MLAAVAFAALAAAACVGGRRGRGRGGGGFRRCADDADCASGMGCDTEGGALGEGYCTPLCDFDDDCPAQRQCPDSEVGPGDCDEEYEHVGDRGICDQFDGSNTPWTCANAEPDDGRCRSDADCGGSQSSLLAVG